MNEIIAIGVIICGVILLILIVKKVISAMVKLGEKGLNAGANKTRQVVSTISASIEKSREEQLRRKLREVVGEEIIRELTRQAIRHGIEPSRYDVCNGCKGAGCSYCGNTGWIKK